MESGERSSLPPTPKPDAASPSDRLAAVAHGLICILGIGYVLWLGSAFLIPFAVAALITVNVSPLMDYLEGRGGLPSWLSSACALCVVALVTVAVCCAGYAGISQIIEAAPKELLNPAFSVRDVYNAIRERLGNDVTSQLGLSPRAMSSAVMSPQALAFVQSWLGSSLGFLSAAGLAMLFLMFLVCSRRSLRGKLRTALRRWRLGPNEADALLADIAQSINRYLWLKTAISVVTGLAFGLTAWAVGLPYAVFWGFLGFVLNFIPSVGPVIASVPPVILCFVEIPSFTGATLAAAALVGVQTISGNVVEPTLMQDKLDLNIVTVLLCLFFWGLVWGPIGALLAVPLTTTCQIALLRYRRTRYLAELMGA